MLKPYTVISETEEHITYQYNPMCSWALYFVLMIFVAAMIIEAVITTYIAVIAFIVYILLVTARAFKVSSQIKKIALNHKIQISGSKHSFKNPLIIVVPKLEN